ncbi:MAG: hypothetical protein FJY16_02400 [Bacteroidetes bacterium]|nr:hypothetical protein [Bacteroidota bacterium]
MCPIHYCITLFLLLVYQLGYAQIRPSLQREVRIQSSAGQQYISLAAKQAGTLSYTISLPAATGSLGQALTLNSSDNNNSQLGWNSVLTPQNGWTLGGNQTPDAFDGNSGSRIGTLSNQDFVIVTNSQEKIRITKTGLLGLGTNNPQHALDVTGNADINGTVAIGDQISPGAMMADGSNFYPGLAIQRNITTASSTAPKTIAVLGQVIGTGKFDNRLMGGAFYTSSEASNSQPLNQMRSIQGWTTHNGSGILSVAWGSYHVSTNRGVGTISNAYGSVSGVENASTGIINKLHAHSVEAWNNGGGRVDTLFGLTVSVYNNNAVSKIGSVYGIAIGKGLVSVTNGTHFWRNTGIIDNSYGLYIDESIDVGINRFAIFSRSKSASRLSGHLELANIDNNAVELRWLEPSLSGNNFTSLKAQSQATDIVLYLPSMSPQFNQVLGAGSLMANHLEWKTMQCIAPPMTTEERDAILEPQLGLIILNTDTQKHQGYNGRGWYDFY